MMPAEEKMNQTLIERYIGLRLLRTFLVVTLVFTLVVWLIQTLNLIDNGNSMQAKKEALATVVWGVAENNNLNIKIFCPKCRQGLD